ncbi:MAG TPA: acyl carrier protein [Propionibacteriaceae bacterium]|nr:acyl carrier protein [Propionibacteriaceae bacterium]
MEQQVRTQIVEFIIHNYLFGDAARLPGDEESLLLTGVLDSTGILELIQFLESDFGIVVQDTETLPDNLGSVANLVRYVSRKLPEPDPAP